MTSILRAILNERVVWVFALFMGGLTYVSLVQHNIWIWGTYALLAAGCLVFGVVRVYSNVSTPSTSSNASQG